MLLKNFIHKYSNLIGIISVIGFASIFFIYCGRSGREDVIASYSLLTVYIFLLIHVLSFGLDQYIMSDMADVEHSKLQIGYSFFYPIITSAVILILLPFISIDYQKEFYATIGLKSVYEINNSLPPLLILITVMFGVYAKLYVSILTKLMVNDAGNLFFIGKAIGFLIGFILALFFSLREWLILLPIFTELLPFTILQSKVMGRYRVFFGFRVNPRYLVSGFNVFAFDAILKTDLILLSFSNSAQSLPVYAILSSVYEGFVQIFSSYRYKFAILVISSKKALFKSEILVPCLWISALFTPAALLFNKLTVNQLDITVITSVLVLQLALFVGVFGVVTFHYLEIKGRPFALTIIGLVCLCLNIMLGSLFVKDFGIIGVSVASFFAYMSLTILNTYLISTYSSEKFSQILKGRL